ncbi:hypothetical protein [Streptomyces sp. NPDC088910]|uniref:hypothetical protein n=1 Tax=Streptomyces sp. NPDC088910 TaxID=3365911 RepID=UPI00380138DE
MRNRIRCGTVVAAALAAATAVLPGTAVAAQDPVHTCQNILVDDANRVAGDGCTGGPAGYEGPGTVKDAAGDIVWKCALLGSAADTGQPGKLIVVGSLGCEEPGASTVA